MLKSLSIFLAFIVFSFPIYSDAQTIEGVKILAQEMSNCLIKNALILDDGISDATTIGRALTITCRKEFEKSIDYNLKGLRNYLKPVEEQNIIDNYKADFLNTAIATVLKLRAKGISPTKKIKKETQ